MQYTKEDFSNGMKVRFNSNYELSGNTVYILRNYNEETGKGRAEDESGSGWNVSYYMIEPAE